MSKLKQLAEIEGLEVMEMIEEESIDSVSPGICINKGCDYTTTVEPDCDNGFCENCNTYTVKSALILGGMI
jgi:hypothetical protein